MMINNSTTPFNQIIEELLDNSKPFSPIHLHRFSDLDPINLSALKAAWQHIEPRRRAALMEDLEQLSEADTLVCFDDLCFMVIQDEDPRVRAAAIRLLWETNETSFYKQLIKIMKSDPDETVRSQAASGLATFVYQGELEEISQHQHEQVETALLNVLSGSEKKIVKRKCLESLGYSSRPEVPDLIRNAYNSTDVEWRISALAAIARSADKRWKENVSRALLDPEPEIRFEAVHAAGELELKNTRQTLMEMLVEPENREDEDVYNAIIWSLSQIGGDNVREVLTALLEQAEDPEEEEFITNALENLGLTEGMDVLGLLEFELDDEDDNDLDIDLYGDEDDTF